ncbi:MAG: hypothetical protein LBK70_03095 [Clostridiales bacterium]|nr:hypothetical protein [Clostridiales bacterium]
MTNEVKAYMFLGATALVVGALYALMAAISTPAIVGPVVLGAISVAALFLAPFLFGISFAANNALIAAIRIMESGRWYKVARNWNWLGIITGYDDWTV